MLHSEWGVWIDSWILLPSSNVFLYCTSALGDVRWSSLELHRRPGAIWSALALVWVAWWLRPRAHDALWRTRLIVASGAVLCIGLIAFQYRTDDAPHFRLTMLDVGDGTCMLIQSGDESIMIDGGSITGAQIGTRCLVPALHALEVAHLDRVIITHANTDHFNGLHAVFDACSVGSVSVSPQFRSSALPDAVLLLQECFHRGIPVHCLERGDLLHVGCATLRCVHPHGADDFEEVNDSSLVFRVTVPVDDRARPERCVVLTGDVEGVGLKRLFRRELKWSDVDVMELPHHGSRDALAMEWASAIQPSVVLQSTGPSRLASSEWYDLLVDSTWCVTARDGACVVEIGSDGSILVERMLDRSWLW